MAVVMCCVPFSALAQTVNSSSDKQDSLAVMGSAGDVEELTEVEHPDALAGYTTTTWSGHTFYHRNTDIAGTKIIPVIDISKWQGTLSKANFTSVKNNGVKGVIIRCAYQNGNGANYTDAQFANNYAQAKAAGLKVGVYIYTEAINTTEAKNQAAYVKNLLAGKSLDLPVVFDYENCLSRVSKNGITRAQGASIATAFLSAIKSYGYEPMLYTGPGFEKSHINATTVRNAGYPIWLARYNSWPYNASSDGAKGWYSGKIDAWQSSGGSGMNCYVSGISGAVDFDWWYDPVTVKVNASTAKVAVGKTVKITPSSTTKHFGATSESYTYTSSNTGVATVSGGTIKGVKAGTATITVKGTSSGKTATCKVTVYQSETVKPVISNVKYSNVTANSYTVTATATDNVGVTQVKFPSWETSKGSSGCTWYEGTKGSSNTWSFTYKGLKSGTSYTTHVYAYDAAGNSTGYNPGSVKTLVPDTTKPVISNAKITNVNEKGFTVTATATDNVGVSTVKFPIWKASEDSSKATWYGGTKGSNNTWTFKFDKGTANTKYTTHVYAYDAAGNYVGYNAGNTTTTNPDKTKPVLSNVKVSNITENGYTVTATATDNVGVSTVKFPTWKTSDGSSKATWYVGKKSGNTWTFTFKNGTPGTKYTTHVYAYDASGNYAYAAASSVTTKKQESAPVYRLYNKTTKEHLYTISEAEYKKLPSYGWKQEGVAWTAPVKGTSVYRLYNKKTSDHHYTASKAEAERLVNASSSGWVYDNGGKAVFYSGGSTPVYRLYNSSLKTGAHHLTTSKTEYNSLVKYGWKQEGIALYALK